MSACFLYQFIMDSSNSNNNNTSSMIPPSNACEGKPEEKMDVALFEVMVTTNVSTNLASDTEASKAILSNLDQIVSAENKSDEDLSKTRESPDVSFDNELNKENMTKKDDSSAVIQNIKTV